ncbi:putative 6-phosphogluconolactonase [Neolecta irregularis DAH-3]|uniref:6-phosphogluconolactonase n=1 Tax=Neolecta irregularis (strain DAH-3) TaxID=1198029 RepID=A0A1U7LH77_NEOID|nr:putative 6-phosphogluconolactonase [Neolecta irregularis DAH-3]|eukprot:OLL22007.1 putative 6-phosphogluconolactonase [Neolecta irregularis DAH-3]
MPTLYSFKQKDVLCSALGKYVKRASRESIKARGRFTIALSGGSLPSQLAQGIVEDESIEWDKWFVFFADERAVPLNDHDSNYRLAEDALFSKVPIPRDQIFAIDQNFLNDTQELADVYEKDLVRVFAAKETVKIPAFDCMLLGVGPDGHTCSLFPNHELLRENIAWVSPIEDSPKPPPRRITLTLTVVTHAHNIAFVAAGQSKQDILVKVLETPDEGLPASLVNQMGGDRVTWFVDDEASKLTVFPKKEFKL